MLAQSSIATVAFSRGTAAPLTAAPREVSAWIEKHRKFWSDKLDALEAILKKEDTAAAKQTKKGTERCQPTVPEP
jgi:hypothetical protein